ncbi:MAG: hypothetical protein HY352_00235 [Candidatus Omnitrophica bacterium]|nr:hypothetical protein [Candidatus Omnitrophota bacterium]
MTTRRIATRWTLGIVTLLALGLTHGAYVAAQMANAPATLQQISGKITAIDVQHGAVKLQPLTMGATPAPSAEQPTTFVVGEDTRISRGLKQAELEELKVGDHVKIDYAKQGGKNVAQAIIVQGSAAEEGAPRAEKAPSKTSLPEPGSPQRSPGR